MQKANQKSSKKREEIKNTGTEKEGKMDQEKTCVFKNKENKLKKEKEKRR